MAVLLINSIMDVSDEVLQTKRASQPKDDLSDHLLWLSGDRKQARKRKAPGVAGAALDITKRPQRRARRAAGQDHLDEALICPSLSPRPSGRTREWSNCQSTLNAATCGMPHAPSCVSHLSRSILHVNWYIRCEKKLHHQWFITESTVPSLTSPQRSGQGICWSAKRNYYWLLCIVSILEWQSSNIEAADLITCRLSKKDFLPFTVHELTYSASYN